MLWYATGCGIAWKKKLFFVIYLVYQVMFIVYFIWCENCKRAEMYYCLLVRSHCRRYPYSWTLDLAPNALGKHLRNTLVCRLNQPSSSCRLLILPTTCCLKSFYFWFVAKYLTLLFFPPGHFFYRVARMVQLRH